MIGWERCDTPVGRNTLHALPPFAFVIWNVPLQAKNSNSFYHNRRRKSCLSTDQFSSQIKLVALPALFRRNCGVTVMHKRWDAGAVTPVYGNECIYIWKQESDGWFRKKQGEKSIVKSPTPGEPLDNQPLLWERAKHGGSNVRTRGHMVFKCWIMHPVPNNKYYRHT